MKQTVTITPAVLDENGVPITDEYDRPITGTPYTVKCAVNEGTKLTRSQSSSGGVNGIGAQEVVSVAQIFFDKKTNVSMFDTITFTDELGNVRVYKPISIEVKRLNGKRILTVVNV
jgi:hypothetical protein